MSEFTYRLALGTFRVEPFNKFSNTFRNCLQKKMKKIHFVGLFCTLYFPMACIVTLVAFVLAFIHCVFSNVSSNGVLGRMHNHIGYICSTFLHCVFSNAYSNLLLRGLEVTLLAFAFLKQQSQCLHLCEFSPVYIFTCILKALA